MGVNFLAYILGSIIIDSKIYYYIFVIIPRLILLMVLYIDVFYFNKLVYIYKAIPIGILLLIGKYVIYSFKHAKEDFIETFKHYVTISMAMEYVIQMIAVELDIEEDDDYPTQLVPLAIFIEFQTDTYIRQDSYYDYMPFLIHVVMLITRNMTYLFHEYLVRRKLIQE